MSEVGSTNIVNEEVERSSIMTEVQTLKVGLIMPISNTEGYNLGHWNDVRRIIEEALSEIDGYNCEVSMVSEAEDVTLIQKTIIQRIYEDDIVIVDVSSKNPNVMFELGVRFAFDKAFILLKDDSTDYSFDISSIHHINYPKDLRYNDIIDMKTQLRNKVTATYTKSKTENSMYLKDFGRYEVANLESTELLPKDYMEKMFNELRSDIKNIKTDVKQSNANKDLSPFFRENVLKNRILYLIKEYISRKTFDNSILYDENHEIRFIIENDEEVKHLARSSKELKKIINDCLYDLKILPF